MALTGITASPNVSSVLTDVDLTAHSKEIIFQAQPEMFFEQIAETRTELGKQPGQTIRFLKMNDLAEGDELVEGTRMAVDDLTTGHVDLTIVEWGKGVALTEYLLRTSAYDLLSGLVKLFADNYARTSNLAFCRRIFQSVPSVLYGHERADRASLTNADVLSTDILKSITEDMAIRKVPKRTSPVNGISSAYIGFIHPHTSRQIKGDSDFIAAKHYGAPEDLFFNELGAYDDIRFVQTTAIPIIKHPGTYVPFGGGAPVTPAATVGHVFIDNVNMTDRKPLMFPAQTIVAGQVIYQSVFVGDRGLAVAEALQAEMRHNGIIDFEREREMAWYAIRGVGLLNDDRLLILETLRSS